MTNAYSLSHLPDHVRLRDLSAHAAHERGATAGILAHLAEIDRRQWHRDEGGPSLAQSCTGTLHMSVDAAARRIQAARVAFQFPTIFECLADGRLHLSAVVLLAPHRTPENADDPYVTLTLRVRRSTRDKLAYAQSLASHALASADLGVYVERAADVLVAHEEKRRFGAGSRSGPRTCGTAARDARAGAARDAHPGAGRRCCGMSARGRARARAS